MKDDILEPFVGKPVMVECRHPQRIITGTLVCALPGSAWVVKYDPFGTRNMLVTFETKDIEVVYPSAPRAHLIVEKGLFYSPREAKQADAPDQTAEAKQYFSHITPIRDPKSIERKLRELEGDFVKAEFIGFGILSGCQGHVRTGYLYPVPYSPNWWGIRRTRSSSASMAIFKAASVDSIWVQPHRSDLMITEGLILDGSETVPARTSAAPQQDGSPQPPLGWDTALRSACDPPSDDGVHPVSGFHMVPDDTPTTSPEPKPRTLQEAAGHLVHLHFASPSMTRDPVTCGILVEGPFNLVALPQSWHLWLWDRSGDVSRALLYASFLAENVTGIVPSKGVLAHSSHIYVTTATIDIKGLEMPQWMVDAAMAKGLPKPPRPTHRQRSHTPLTFDSYGDRTSGDMK